MTEDWWYGVEWWTGTFRFEDAYVFAYSCSGDSGVETREDFAWVNWVVRGPRKRRVVDLARGMRIRLLDEEIEAGPLALFKEDSGEEFWCTSGKIRYTEEISDRLITFTVLAEERGWRVP